MTHQPQSLEGVGRSQVPAKRLLAERWENPQAYFPPGSNFPLNQQTGEQPLCWVDENESPLQVWLLKKTVWLNSMASRIVPLLGLFLFAITTTSVSHAQSSKAFQRKHVTFLEHIDHNQCNSEMRNKRISQTDSGCKRLNTFIHAPEQVVDQACTAGKPYVIRNQEYKKSPQKLRITNCRLSQGDGNDCEYVAEASSWRYIVVACDQNGRPVHLERTLTDAAAGKPDEKQPDLNSASAMRAHWFRGQGSLCLGLLLLSFVLFWCL